MKFLAKAQKNWGIFSPLTEERFVFHEFRDTNIFDFLKIISNRLTKDLQMVSQKSISQENSRKIKREQKKSRVYPNKIKYDVLYKLNNPSTSFSRFGVFKTSPKSQH